MKRRLKWTKRAWDELREIAAYIARENPPAAVAFKEYVKKITTDLTISPIGRRSVLPDTMERVLTRYPNYIVIFQYDASTVTILRVFHGARNIIH